MHVSELLYIWFLWKDILIQFFLDFKILGQTVLAARTCTSIVFFNFKNLLRLWYTFCNWIINLIETPFIVYNLLHLLLWYESTMVSKSVVSKILAAMISYMIYVHSLFLFFPILKNLISSFFLRHWGTTSLSVAW